MTLQLHDEIKRVAHAIISEYGVLRDSKQEVKR
jgi:hypothetical protein